MSLSDVDYIRIFCWAHTYRNISEKLNTLKDKEHKNNLLLDISSMQSLPTEDIFEKAVSLFYIKYGNKIKEIDTFLEYFCVQKIESNSGWYEAIKRDNWCPTTTN